MSFIMKAKCIVRCQIITHNIQRKWPTDESPIFPKEERSRLSSGESQATAVHLGPGLRIPSLRCTLLIWPQHFLESAGF